MGIHIATNKNSTLTKKAQDFSQDLFADDDEIIEMIPNAEERKAFSALVVKRIKEAEAAQKAGTAKYYTLEEVDKILTKRIKDRAET